MYTIESLRHSVTTSLAKILLQHSKNSNRWFYAIKLHHTHETSLSHFLEMSNSDMYELLQLIGLMSPQQRIKIESFKVIINQYLPNVNIYFDKFKAYKIPTNSGETTFQSYHGYWLGMGDIDNNSSSDDMVISNILCIRMYKIISNGS